MNQFRSKSIVLNPNTNAALELDIWIPDLYLGFEFQVESEVREQIAQEQKEEKERKDREQKERQRYFCDGKTSAITESLRERV